MNGKCSRKRVVALTALAVLVAGCNPVRPDQGITGKTIRYQVEFFGSPVDRLSHTALNITYATSDGAETQKNVSLPWTKVIGPAGRGFTASVKAQFNGFGIIVCRIVADSKVVVKKASPQEPYAEVACST